MIFIFCFSFQLTIEHDPEAISRRRPSFSLSPKPPNILTTTSSDTNIPQSHSANNNTFGSSNSLGSNNSLNIPVNKNSNPNLNLNFNQNLNVVNVVNKAHIVTSPTAKEKSISPTTKADKERLFKRRDEGYMSGTRSRQLRRKNNLCETRQSLDKERSSSMSRLLDE